LNLTAKSEGKSPHYEFHKEGCPWLEQIERRKKIGNFIDCREAIKYAKLFYLG